MTEDEVIELLLTLLGMHRGALVEFTAERRPNNWIAVQFANGQQIAITVEEL